MNKSEKDYAIKRLAESRNKLLEATKQNLMKKFWIPEKTITDEVRCELVRSGKVKLKNEIESISKYTNISHLFDFSKYVKPAYLDPKAKWEQKEKAIHDNFQEMQDAIMLGSSEEALQMIKDYSAKVRKQIAAL